MSSAGDDSPLAHLLFSYLPTLPESTPTMLEFTQHVSPLRSGVNSNSIWSMGSHLPSGMSWELMCCGGPIDATDAIAGGAMNCFRGFPEQHISWR